jgi:magnesium transporter
MQILTAVTVLITLPNVIFGMYGMNIDLPFQDQPWAYSVVILVSIIIAVSVYVIGRKRRIF